MKRQNKLNTQAQEHQVTNQQAAAQSTREFGTVEELLRHDALHTPVPPAVAYRLRDSIERTSRRRTGPWWRRLFSRPES